LLFAFGNSQRPLAAKIPSGSTGQDHIVLASSAEANRADHPVVLVNRPSSSPIVARGGLP